jgi:hypothetical protein
MRGDEERVVDAFCAWLEDAGWTVTRDVDFVDVVPSKDGQKLYAEAKGRTGGNGPGCGHDWAPDLEDIQEPGGRDLKKSVRRQSHVALRWPELVRARAALDQAFDPSRGDYRG